MGASAGQQDETLAQVRTLRLTTAWSLSFVCLDDNPSHQSTHQTAVLRVPVLQLRVPGYGTFTA